MSSTDRTAAHGLCECGCGELAPLASVTRPERGWIKGRPVRFVRYHQNRPIPPLTLYEPEDRGFRTPCWIWRGTTSDEYGLTRRGKQRIYAHRWFYEHFRGQVPGGLDLDHLCRVPLCVNPDHLEAVTTGENIRRGRVAKLGFSGAFTARLMCLSTDLSGAAIADALGVNYRTISTVLNGESWPIFP